MALNKIGGVIQAYFFLNYTGVIQFRVKKPNRVL